MGKRDTLFAVRIREVGKRRLEMEAVRGGEEVSVSELVRESLDALILAADARGVPMREVVAEIREEHRDDAFNRPEVRA